MSSSFYLHWRYDVWVVQFHSIHSQHLWPIHVTGSLPREQLCLLKEGSPENGSKNLERSLTGRVSGGHKSREGGTASWWTVCSASNPLITTTVSSYNTMQMGWSCRCRRRWWCRWWRYQAWSRRFHLLQHICRQSDAHFWSRRHYRLLRRHPSRQYSVI